MECEQYTFGAFTLRRGDCLLREGQVVPMAPKELTTLELLVARAGSLVTKDELIRRVWTGGMASDESVSRCIYMIRKALGDHVGTRYIQTLHRRGYRFCAPVCRDTPPQTPHPGVRSIAQGTPAAYDALRQGQVYLALRTRGACDLALGCFEHALRVDADYAAAYAAIAHTRLVMLLRGFARPTDAAEQIILAADMALQRDPSLPMAHAATALVRGLVFGDRDAALSGMAHALKNDPADGYVRATYARLLMGLRQYREAELELTTAIQHAPYLADATLLPWLLVLNERYDAAVAEAEACVANLPRLDAAYAALAYVSARVGQAPRAVEAGLKAASMSNRDPGALAVLAYAYAATGQAPEALKIYDEITAAADNICLSWSLIAPVAATLGKTEAAIHWLRRGLEERCPHLAYTLDDPRLSPLAGDEAFEQIRAEVHGSATGVAQPA